MSPKRVAVIGAGPGGLSAAKAIDESGLDVQVFEATDDIGGQWNLSSPSSALWPSLYMNQSRRLSEFSDFPWEEAVPFPSQKDFAGLYPSPREAKEYLDAYSEKFNLRRFVRFKTVVKSCTVTADDKWDVTVASGTSQEVLVFDFLVVATGRYGYPHDPLNDSGGSLNNYSGTSVHSSKFRHVIDKVKGKRVLVVGNSVSGVEIATEAVLHGAKYVAHSARKPRYSIETLALTDDGSYRATDEVMFTRLPVWLGKVLPESMNAAGLKSLVDKYWKQAENVEECFKPNPDIMKASVSISRLPYNKYVDSGDITLKTLPASANGSRVTFLDGSTEEFDVIVSATGYEIKLEFLPESVLQEITVNHGDDDFLALYKYTMMPSHPTVAFVGMFRMIGTAFPSAEIQGRWIAQVFSGRLSLPPRSRMEQAIETWAKQRIRPGYEHALLTEVNEDIAAELGIAPSFCSAIMDSKRRLTGPLYPCEYRAFSKLDSEDVQDAARLRFQQYCDKPKAATLSEKEMEDLRIGT